MKFERLVLLAVSYCALIIWGVNQKTLTTKVMETSNEQQKYDGPEQFAEFHRAIRTAEGATGPEYKPGYKVQELVKARTFSQSRKGSGDRFLSGGTVVWTERGPSNVPGRTRGLIVDPDDPGKNTWYAGSAGGGVWKTSNAGVTWMLLTPDLPNLATTVLVMSPSNHNIIYMGTGEGFGNIDGILGGGMYKSIDRGQTWNHLASTMSFKEVNRAIVSPNDADMVVVATNAGIYRTIDGGVIWTQVSSLDLIQDLKANPSDFNIQYAAQNGVGVIKSIDGGQSWNLSNVGMSIGGRLEIAISPVNTNRIFGSAEGSLSGSESDLYISNDAGVTWSIINATFNGSVLNFLGGQGWYDNTIACDPFSADVVYFGGVDLFRLTLGTGSQVVANYSMAENNTSSFLFLVAFSNIPYSNQRLSTGPDAGEKSVEIRFGPGISQNAHRFTVPAGATSGVPVSSYSYANYISVPFQAWDITDALNPRQLMVSFRDQNNNNQFDLVTQDFGTDPLLNSREYVYINNVDYVASPNGSIALAGGQVHKLIYNFFPALATGAVWQPGNLPVSSLLISYTGIEKINASTITVSDAYGQYDGKNRFINFGVDFHPDKQDLVMIPMTASTFKILNSSDGGVFVSNISATPGIQQGNWTMAGRGYNTSQFYGADKKPGFEEYLGGTQDNGTWRSPTGIAAASSTEYLFNIGGDGFEVIWHNLDDKKLIGGSQGNNFRRSIDGGVTWSSAVAGLFGSHPFISKLANSRSNPDLIFTLSSAGVFRSINFGASWTLASITNKWGAATSLMDVEVSRANANVVWAGSGMVSTGTLRNLHFSIDAGITFSPAENSPLISGSITKLASHPFEENTAYALFSQAENPKILRTTDLGQTWTDISGFGTGDVSTTGFPDVAVYCLYVRPDDPNIIWAGTEIGIVESIDNGQTWAMIDDFPNLSVWDMKGQDDQVVIATHGRGIWTASIGASQFTAVAPSIIASGTSPKEKLLLKVHIEEAFDRVDFYDGTTLLGTLPNVSPSDLIVTIDGLSPGAKNVKLISYKGSAPFHSKTYSIDHLNILSVENSFATYFDNLDLLAVKGFFLQNFPGSPNGARKSMQSSHPYTVNFEHTAIIRHPVKVSSVLPKIYYDDIAIVEPGIEGAPFNTAAFKDYVVMEASKNGLDWIALEDGYNARKSSDWLSAFNGGALGTGSMYVSHEISLTDKFSVGDTLLFRYRFFSNASITGWGAAVDHITIQEVPTAIEKPKSAMADIKIYPNPTSGDFTAEFVLAETTDIRMELFDLNGRALIVRDLGQKMPGKYQELFQFRHPPGTYFVLLHTNSGKLVRKVVLTR